MALGGERTREAYNHLGPTKGPCWKHVRAKAPEKAPVKRMLEARKYLAPPKGLGGAHARGMYLSTPHRRVLVEPTLHGQKTPETAGKIPEYCCAPLMVRFPCPFLLPLLPATPAVALLHTWGGGLRLSEYAGWYFRMFALVHLLQRESSTWPTPMGAYCALYARCAQTPPIARKNYYLLFLLGESGTVVPLLTSAASAPWCPSHASAGMLHTKSFPRQQSLDGPYLAGREGCMKPNTPH